MAPVPKRKHSTQRSRKREQKLKVVFKSLSVCSKCKAPKKPHRLCPKCGKYK